MIKIKKFGCEYNIDKGSLATITPAFDGIRVILSDNTEINFMMSVPQELKAVIPLVMLSNANNICLDLDAAERGEFNSVVSIQCDNYQSVGKNDVTGKFDFDPPKKSSRGRKKTSGTKTGTKKKSVGRPSKKSKSTK